MIDVNKYVQYRQENRILKPILIDKYHFKFIMSIF